MSAPEYPFLKRVGRTLNSGQSRTVILSGNIYDLFFLEGEPGHYVSLIDFLCKKWDLPDRILIVYEINGPIRFVRETDIEKMREAWLTWRTGVDTTDRAIQRVLSTKKVADLTQSYSQDFDSNLRNAIGSPTLALEMLRQLCLCSRSEVNGKRVLPANLLIVIEGVDLILPMGEITSLSDMDRHRISICHDWFSDPGFMEGKDGVVLLTESRSLINDRVARLPQLLEVPVASPNDAERKHFISWFMRAQAEGAQIKLWGTEDELAIATAGLTVMALMQILKGAAHDRAALTQDDVIARVEDFIKNQIGEDMVEFKKPSHTLEQVVGFTALKNFIRAELLPRFASAGDDALPGAAVCGPIGGGKTFIFEAVASELDMVVLVLKNIRSQWFGQTDVLFERLRRVLEALSKVLIFVDEADTQFGGVDANTHETERRLTGKIQAMMSDSKLRGRVIWLLMTARIHLLSPDIRRPGRVGDLIIPILDPEGDDRRAFLEWILAPVLAEPPTADQIEKLSMATHGDSAATFAALRSELKAKKIRKGAALAFDEIMLVLDDHIPPAIEETRRYQTLQALINCTRRSLLPEADRDDAARAQWQAELRTLEARGVS